MASHDAPLTPVAEGVWTAIAPVRILGTRLNSTMTVLRLREERLLIHSPVELTPERRAAVEALGTVELLYAPNLFHHVRVGEWAEAFPTARVRAPHGLEKKRPELRIDSRHGEETEAAFVGVVDEVCVEGCRLRESVIFHRPSRTLVVADLVHNIGRDHRGWTKLYTRMTGFYDRIALSRAIRWTAFSDRNAARKSLDEILSLPFKRIVVGHGTPVSEHAPEALAAAYSWLPQ
jgi:hypothetical protein